MVMRNPLPGPLKLLDVLRLVEPGDLDALDVCVCT